MLNDLGVVEDQLGQDREALAHLHEALRQEPSLAVAQNNVGIVHVHRAEWDAAAAAFEEVIALDTRFHRAHYNLGVVRAAQGRTPEARVQFEEAARLAPRDASVRYNLGLLRREEGVAPASERRAYEEALALDPDLAEAHLALGAFLADPATPAALRDPQRAVTHLQRFLDLASPSDGDGRLQARSWLRWLAESGTIR